MENMLITSILAATIVSGTPLILAAMGELVTEKAGVLNLGAEGMMSIGAVTAFAVVYSGGSPALGVVAAMLAACAMALAFGFLTLTMLANQVASGLALALFGVGLAAFIGKPFEAAPLPHIAPLAIPLLDRIPVIGPALFRQQSMVYVSWLVVACVLWFLYRSRWGLVLRAVGESPSSAHAVGYRVIALRYAAVAFGGAMAGMGGAFMSVFYTPLWAEGMVAGRGWIALALVVFATWRPMRVVAGAYLFGGVMVAQLFAQGAGLKLDVPSQLMSALPYAATIAVLVIISRNASAIRLHSPASLGQPFRADA
ncbi:ABC transporter permease [Duganella sp. FT92W]|uniref:ABC transporter permease n=1 Tax=Pseudoduganella rivuli TaxID=2666085 RepID=A0A7X2IRH1_9BURK|nr:ABC transporter permease [Pseudoduganella rivuli]MRV74696.1 ABC transporter permease [Pseudoduganella rivuli]